MSERFKFRLWDNINKRYVKDMHFRLDGVVCYDDGHPYCNGEHQDDFTIEQCTGLTDKNGKLIYEGDVFEATVLNSFDGDEMIGKRIRGQVAYYVDEAAFTFAAYSPFNLSKLEIIGNIHEMELENER